MSIKYGTSYAMHASSEELLSGILAVLEVGYAFMAIPLVAALNNEFSPRESTLTVFGLVN